MQKKIFQTIAKISLLCVVSAIFLHILPAKAAGTLTNVSDTISPQTASASADHTFVFTLETALSDSNNTKIEIFFPAGFDASALNGDSDVAISGSTHGSMVVTSNCMNPGTQIAAVTGGATWIPFQLCNGAGAAFDAGETVTILLGTNAGGTGQIVNPPAGDSLIITIQTTYKPGIPIIFLDIGHTAVSIIDNAQVEITATVDPTFTFTLSSNTCALGILTTANVKTCTYVSTVSTNAAGGYVATIRAESDGTNIKLNNDANAAIFINDVVGGVANAGSEEYGFSIGQFGFGLPPSFNSDDAGCNQDASEPAQPLFATPVIYAGSSGPVTGNAETICHVAAISATSEAGTYRQTVTLIATGRF